VRFLNDKSVTRYVLSLLCALTLSGQRADSLKGVQSVYVESLGTNEGAGDLRRELIEVIRHTHRLNLVQSADQADAVLEGKGALWVRGYHSLSPRARVDSSSAEPVYTGYLSIKVQGKGGETLWSYLANPKRVSFGDLKHDLATQLVGKLVDDIATGVDGAVAAAGPSGAAVTLRGAGATFPYPIYQDWFQSFHARHPGWQFQYEPVGSERGLAQLAAGKVDFAGSDIPADASVQQFASVRGAVVLIYNLPRFGDDLRLTREVLAGIFSGKIKAWNDPALRALNRRSSLPNAPITIVHRAEGSGTTFALTGFLAKASANWNWQTGIPAAGNEGVAKLVADTPYSLGYVEFIYAFDHRLSFASIANASGHFIQPDLASIAAEGVYPIATYTWLVVHEPLEAGKREAMMSFLEWMLTSGQRQCSALGYAPLPKDFVDRELQQVKRASSTP